ncbi:YadA domain-containing structural protein [Synechococcus phage S-CAM22]|uniref:YadA domain-containing structural protein n=1 Tax=Synechococcus phage S-CAM22 TaxID=1883365 RepID=A0A1D8KRT3_9CAUD|nr:structural protein [Synechococcus phage S-CAM22]AOV61346.1 YadA domain-containing structural protein [Synechococcus phage S-CAM22]
MANRIQLRRGNGQEWQNSNPILAQGELGIELDTGRFKIGDGVTPWNTLRYERPIESTSNTANTLVQRDTDGNFSAATITATLIGNASTSSRLASSRQIQLSGDVSGSEIFDGSENISISASLDLLSSLPHHDNTDSSSATYTKVTVDAKGRVINASNPTTLAAYNLNGTVEGQSAQAYDLDLVALAGLTTTGLISRTATNTMATRTITGTSGKINVNNGDGVSGNPTLDLATTTVDAGNYNTESLTSVSAVGSNDEPFGTETVNAVKFTVDDRGRLTSATNVPIATATEGSKYPNYSAGTAYTRYAIIQNASKVYQAIADISAGAGAPTHSSGDSGSWRYLAAEATEQKGLASFAQEDFDVDSNGHVTIAALGVDNTQLQNNRIGFADGNTVENFELDQELTATTGYRGFNYLNYVKVNNTSGNLLFGANNTGDGGAGEIDVNVRSYFSDPDITLDGAVAQTLDKSGDGNLTFSLTQNSANARNLSILSTNSGDGTSTVTITAEDVVDIDASAGTGKVHVENARFQGDYIGSTGTLNLDPGDDRGVSGLVRVWGDLQVDGVTTTVNSTTLQVDDVIMTLGGDTAPGSDDNKDRGVEFRYYDSQARLGFYGWDTNYTDLAGHEGGFTFLHAATNNSEVFSGTASGITAGNLKLTTGTASSSNTTGDLVVAGGAGITGAVNIGGNTDIDGTLRITSTSRFDDSIVLQGASKTLQLNNGSGTTKIELQSTTGNASIGGVTDITGNLNVNTNKFNVVASSGNTSVAGTLAVTLGTTLTGALDLNNNANISGLVHLESADEPDIVSGAPHTIQNNDYGALRVDGGAYFHKNVLFNGDVFLNGDFNQQEDATENYGLRNYLSVRYKMRAGSVAAYNPSFSNSNTSNLRVFGGAGVNQNLHVGATNSGEGFFVGKKNSGDSVKFSVLGASGNTDIQGTLDVAGNSEFNGTVDVDANFAVRSGTTDKFTVASSSGNTNIEGTLTADGHTELNSTLNVDDDVTFGAQLTVTGATEFNNTVDVDANFAVRSGSTDKMTVASSSGNIATDGTLVVQGQTTINDSLIVQSDNEVVNVNNGSGVTKFSIDTDNGNTNIIGTLTVGDATQINDTLGASGVVTFTRNTQQTLTGSYAADGAFRLTGGAAIGKNLAVSGDARVYGATELTGALDLNSSADISGALVTHDNVTITADNKTFAIQNASAANKLTVDTDNGNTDIRGTLDVGGDVTAESNLTITGNLTVNGTTTTVNSTVTTLDDPIITVGGDTAPQSNDGKDRGVEFRYYDGSAKIGFFGFDRSAQQFAFLTSASNSSEVLTGTDGALRAGSLNLTGSGTGLDVDANANIDGTLTVDGQIISQVSSGPALVIPTTAKINNLNADLLDSMTTASANTASTVVNRDANGDFAAGTITAALVGNASTATTLQNARDIILEGVVTGTVSFNGSANVSITTSYSDADITALAAMTGTGFVARTADNTYARRTLAVTSSSGITLTNADGVSGNPTINVASTANNSANNLVLRDASGNFAAGVITAALTGNVTGTVSDISNHDTGDLTEGSNLYYTDERVDDRVNALIVAGTGITKAYNDSAGTYTLTVTQADIDTDNVTEGSTNLFTTAARTRTHFTYGTGIELSGSGALSVTQADINTDNVTEGSTNIFFTNARSDARFDTKLAAADTDDLSEGSTNLYYTDARANARVAAATGANLDLSNKSTTHLAEGNNLYYTEARVQDKLDNAFEQLRAMLNNLAASTTLVLNLSGDPTPGDVTALNNSSLAGGTGYNTATAVATTTDGDGTGLTVNITASGGVITAVAINVDGSGYAVGDTITITGGGGNATIDVSAVVEMAVGDTLTGGTSGTTGVITAVGTNQVTVNTVNGFFKKTETVAAGDVSTLTIQSFA